MNGKQWYLSKTLWFNVLALVVIIANAFGYANFVPDAQTAEYGAALITLINVILRLVTSQKLTK